MSTNAKEAILETAYDLFSQTGFSGTSIKMIAEQLNISTSLIFHHFKSKEALWVQVELFAVNVQKNKIQEIRLDTLEHFLSDILNVRLEWYRDEKFRKLFHWRCLEKNIQDFAELAKAETSIETSTEASASPSVLNIPFHVKKAQTNGLIKKELDPQVVATLIFANSSYAILDYINYYGMQNKQLDQFKEFSLQALLIILADENNK